ncbi:MAG: PBP1A family penicillin-binding protein [bacterium]
MTPEKPKGCIFFNTFRRKVYLVALLLAVLIMAFSYFFRKFLEDVPSIYALEGYTPSLTTRVYDITGQVIHEFSIEKRALLPLNKIPVDIQNAVIAAEDNRFFRHWGISPKGIARSLLRDLLHRRAAQGGSTITQQLSRGIFLKPEKTISRKVKEILIAMQIEHNFSKQEILQLYLNQIYFGSGAYGVQSASRLFFGKEVHDMTLGECALLAGLVPSPNKFSPFVSPDKARLRRSLVLKRMLDEGYITKGEMETAQKEQLPQAKYASTGGQAPYFVEYIRQVLEPRYGIDILWKGGLNIYTTLDLKTQTAAERIMEKNLARYDEQAAKERAGKVKEQTEEDQEASTRTWKIQGAFVMLDLKTGAVKALIGGRDYKESQFNRAVQAYRQPGSVFKPFVYMSAMMNGYTAASIINDSPLAYYYDGRDWRLLEGATDQQSIDLAIQPFVGNKDFSIWTPNDFDSKFLGPITLRRGLELSRNLASIYLVDKIGAQVVVETAKKAGVTRTLDAVPSIGLGTSVVSPLEIANAIGTFANGGIHVKPFSILKVADQRGKILEEHIVSETEEFSPRYAYLITNLMRGVVERGTARYARRLKRPMAGKTGTTQENRDLWFVGMNPDMVAIAWMGYDDFASLGGKDWTGGGTVVPWWTEIMEEVLKDQPVRDFSVPEGILFVTIDQETGKLALPSCKKRLLEAFIKGTEPKTFCDANHESAPPPAAVPSVPAAPTQSQSP